MDNLVSISEEVRLLRQQTTAEEIANSISHGLGVVAALAAGPYLIVEAVRHGGPAFVAGCSVFVATIIGLYLTSTLYHAFRPGRAKEVFQGIERSAIFLLIAGTYTPLTLGVLRGPWGWSLFGVIWALAALGVALHIFGVLRHPLVSTPIYIAMGWVAIIAIRPLWQLMPHAGFVWLFAGGLLYTVGAIFFLLDHRFHYCHLLWHFFVLGGTAAHYVMILRYAAA